MKRSGAPFTDEAADDMLTIEPPPFSTMPGRKAWIVQNMLRTLRSKAKSPLLVGGVEHRAVMDEARAIEQHVDRAGLLGEGADGRLVEHVELAACGCPATPSSAASLPASTSVAQTVAPSRAKARAVAAPIPCPAAVTTQTLPFSRMCPSPISHQLGDEYRERRAECQQPVAAPRSPSPAGRRPRARDVPISPSAPADRLTMPHPGR